MISIRKGSDGKPRVFYKNNTGQPGADFFLLKISSDTNSYADYSVLTIIVRADVKTIINTVPDRATTLAGKKVVIDILANDNSDVPMNQRTVQLVDDNGDPGPNSKEFRTAENNIVTLEIHDGRTIAVFVASGTPKNSDSVVTDRFHYLVKDKQTGESEVTYVEVDILPCCEDTRPKAEFKLPDPEYCKNDLPVEFTIEVQDGPAEGFEVTGPGVSNTKPSSPATGKWMFDPRSAEVNKAVVTFRLVGKDSAATVLGTMQVKVHPVITAFKANGYKILANSQAFYNIVCDTVMAETDAVAWFINGRSVSGDAQGMSDSGPIPQSTGSMTVTVRAYYNEKLEPDCFHEITQQVILEVFMDNVAKETELIVNMVTRYSYISELTKYDFVPKGGPPDPELKDDSLALSRQISEMLMDKTEISKISKGAKDNVFVEAASLLDRLNIATKGLDNVEVEKTDALFMAYKNNAMNLVTLAVLGTGKSAPSTTVVQTLSSLGEHFTAMKEAGQIGEADRKEMQDLADSVQSPQLKRIVLKLAEKM
jgi:hypothetical protein